MQPSIRKSYREYFYPPSANAVRIVLPTGYLGLLYFLMEGATVGNITPVAQRIHLSQSAITRAMAIVERFL